MPTLHVTLRSGAQRTAVESDNRSVMEAMRFNGVDEVLALCGGCCSCATCHVYVDPEFLDRLPRMSESENELLDGTEHRAGGSRLSCQIPFTAALDGLRVTVAPED